MSRHKYIAHIPSSSEKTTACLFFSLWFFFQSFHYCSSKCFTYYSQYTYTSIIRIIISCSFLVYGSISPNIPTKFLWNTFSSFGHNLNSVGSFYVLTVNNAQNDKNYKVKEQNYYLSRKPHVGRMHESTISGRTRVYNECHQTLIHQT
jgi:hypothetical protein